MKVSLNWLSEYVDLKGISLQEIVDKLTLSGLEIEDIIEPGKDLNGFKVGFVKEKKQHPNADRLSLCVVDDGEQDYSVICGAPNVEAGQKIAFAAPGCIIPQSGTKLKTATIRGVKSNGMICSEKELGIGDAHEGIIVLDPSLEAGTPLAEALNLNDAFLDISVTPNRADALSHVGIARDLAAIFNLNLKLPEFELNESGPDSSGHASVEILNETDCPRYIAIVIKGVTITESPGWLKEKLLSVGLRPINNVVDVTNFVLYELGQPLHAFDLKFLEGNKIVVKSAGKIDKFVTLDSKVRNLRPEDLLICDAGKPVAIAGVMGGENSEVTAETKDLLIESAYFNPSSIRKTSKNLGLSTDASYRFERGCDPEITLFAAQRAAALITSLAGGEVSKGAIDIYPNPISRKSIKLRPSRINFILGFNIKKEEVIRILSKLEFSVDNTSEDLLTVEVPLFRHDLEREIDLIEEVARIFGYDKIPSAEKISITLDEKIDQSKFNDKLRYSLKALNFNEIITNSLLNEETAEKFGKSIKVLNPQSLEMSNSRTSLLPGALMTIARNFNLNERNLRLFEIGNIFVKNTESDIKDFKDFSETEHLLMIIAGNAESNEWYSKERGFDFFDIKGVLEEVLKEFPLDNVTDDSYYFTAKDFFEFGLEKKYKKQVLISGGKLLRDIAGYFDLSEAIYYFDLNLSLLKEIPVKPSRFNELLRYPKVVRDMAFVVESNIGYEIIKKTIFEGSSKLLKNVKLFDIFESESLGSHKKSLAFQLEYFDDDRTLTEEEIDKDFWRSIKHVETKLKAKLRG